MKNNPVFQVLVVTNGTLLAAGGAVETLGVGQLGIFDADTHLSVAHDAALPNRFYFASGLPNQAGTLGDIRKSAGQYITKSLMKETESKEYTAPENQVISMDLTGFVPSTTEDEEYSIRFNFLSGQLMNLNGYNLPVKSFTITVPAGTSLADFKTKLLAEVNADEEGIVVAANAVGDVITFTIGAEDKVLLINGINKRYDFLRQLKATLSMSGGFENLSYSIVTSTGPVYEQGSGYDIQQLEYVAGGFIGNPGIYRDSVLNGIMANEIEIFATKDAKYWVLRLMYGKKYTSGGSLDYESYLETVIAVEQNATTFTMINQLVTMINTYLTGEKTTVTTISTTTTTTTTIL